MCPPKFFGEEKPPCNRGTPPCQVTFVGAWKSSQGCALVGEQLGHFFHLVPPIPKKLPDWVGYAAMYEC